MNWVHIHLMTNHVPVIGTIIGALILGYALRNDSAEMKRFSLGYFVVLGAITILVYLTGEPAEEAIERLPGFSEAVIEKHEDASVFALAALLFVSTLSLAGLVIRSLGLPQRRFYWRALMIAVIVAVGLMGWVANLGGKVRHTEITGPSGAEPGFVVALK
jgi:MFS family permease